MPYQRYKIFKDPGADCYWDPKMFVWKIWGECQFQEKEVNVIKDGFCEKNMWWRSGFGVPWLNYMIFGGDVLEMKRNAMELGCFTNKISEQDIFCYGVYGP